MQFFSMLKAPWSLLPKFEKNKDRWTRSKISFEAENVLQATKLKQIEKKFKLKKETLVIWSCEFQAMLKETQYKVFTESNKPYLIYFSRLSARECLIGGVRTVLNYR